MKKIVAALVLLIAMVSTGASAFALPSANTAVIYKNEACGHCNMYLSSLKALLEEKGFQVIEKSMINDLDARTEWTNFHQKNNIPIELQGHLSVILNDRLVIEGHVPERLVKQLLEKFPSKQFPLLVVYQDAMVDDALMGSYKVWSNGAVQEYAIEKNVSDWSSIPAAPAPASIPLVGLVSLSGLLAGIHPCTISVLLLFLAFLFTLRQGRLTTLKIGGGYIFGVFLAYLLIGLGLLVAVSITEPHLSARIAGILILILGVYNLFRLHGIHLPSLSFVGAAKPTIAQFVKKNSFWAAFMVGILVGICSFGCTAGIYFSVIGLLLTNPLQGFSLLVLYNVMFVLPLVVILLAVTRKSIAEKVQAWQQKNNYWIELLATLFMIAAALWLLFGLGGM